MSATKWEITEGREVARRERRQYTLGAGGYRPRSTDSRSGDQQRIAGALGNRRIQDLASDLQDEVANGRAGRDGRS